MYYRRYLIDFAVQVSTVSSRTRQSREPTPDYLPQSRKDANVKEQRFRTWRLGGSNVLASNRVKINSARRFLVLCVLCG
jgi:hypothetical protein